jgi:DMSO/TMAO reductase YedYZ molybdopterin-dependent catalytic subunit
VISNALAGVSVDTLLDGIETSAGQVIQFSDGGYTTNPPLEDITGGEAWVSFAYDGEPLEPEHGGRRGCSSLTFACAKSAK